MKAQEIINIPEQTPKRLDRCKPVKNFSYIVGEALGLIACMCVAAIIIALTVKFIMWIL